jgi:radical SAM superfamily enzyme YgiQ (UPF0313 family)
LPANLDDQPLADRSLTARYRKYYYYLFEPEVAAIRTSVGCSFPCSFCSCRVYSQAKFIPRSPESVVDEIASLDEDFIMFCDDHSFHDPERMRAMGQALLDRGIKKRYFAYARADSIVENRDVFALWAKAGLTLVMTGLESVEEDTLRRTGKKTSISQNEEALRIIDALGIQLSAGFLLEPDITEEGFAAIDRYVASHPSILLAEFTPLTPFPGTPLHRRMRDRLVTQDRQLFDLQHFVVETAMPSKQLYRLMLRSYRAVVVRIAKRLRLWRPTMFLSPHVLRVLLGLYRNHMAFRRAHRIVESRVTADPARSSLDESAA